MNESSKPAGTEALTAAISERSGVDLEFPDWRGMQPAPATLSMEELLRYCETTFPHLRSFPGWQERRLAGRCRVEFTL